MTNTMSATHTTVTPTGLSATQLIAHRGYQRHFPENSPLAIQQAIRCGAQFVEVDVQFSADGIPVLYHDDSLNRVSGIDGLIKQHTFTDLQKFSAGEPQRFGTKFSDVSIAGLQALVDIMQQHPSVQVLVELKEEATRDYGATFCLQRIHAVLSPVLSRCILISFDLDALQQAQQHGLTRLGAVLRDWSSRFEVAKKLSAEMIICNHLRIPTSDSLQMDNCRVAVYEVDNRKLAQSLLARGASLIETFAIGEMLDHHEQH